MVRAIPSSTECKRRIQEVQNAKKKASNTQASLKVTYLVLPKASASTSKCGCTGTMNFNKYANQMIKNKPNLPAPTSPRFANKVKSIVKRRYRTNNPTLPNLADNSSYIARAIAKLRSEFNRIKSASPKKSPSNAKKSPVKSVDAKKSPVKSVDVKKTYTIPRQAKKTKSLFTQRKKELKAKSIKK